MDLYLVWYDHVWVDYDRHYEHLLVGVFDTFEKADKEREQWEAECEHLYCDDQQVYVQKVKINETLLTEHEAKAWY